MINQSQTKKKLSFACFTTLDGVAASARLHLSYVETLQLISLEVAFCLLFGHKSGTQIQYKNKEWMTPNPKLDKGLAISATRHLL